MGELEQQRRRRPRLSVTRPGLVVPVPRDPRGRAGPTKAAASGPGWRRTSRGLYVPVRVDGGRVDQRIVEAAAVLPAFGGVTGWAALRWAGGRWFSGSDAAGRPHDVVLAVGCADVRPQRGIGVSAESLGPDELTVLDGLPVTMIGRAVLFEMRYAASLAAAVVVADMAAYDDLVSLVELRKLVDEHLPQTGIIQAREALALAVENAWSPMEVETRLLWGQAGLPMLRCNVPVFDLTGRHLGTPDLLDSDAGLVVEFNGAAHLDVGRRRVDRDREERFARAGLELVEVMGADFADRVALTARLARQRQLVLAQPRLRRWTTELPSWWTDTSTVEARRALSPYDQARLLAYRRPAA